MIAVLAIALAITMAALVIVVISRESGKVPVYGENNEPVDGPVEKNDGTISAPGYEMLTLKADTARQGFALANPVQNNCYMKISIVLEDGSAIWTSKPTAPGAPTDEIVLSPTLPEGRYDGAKIIYNCFSDKNCTESLNTVVIDLYLLAKAD